MGTKNPNTLSFKFLSMYELKKTLFIIPFIGLLGCSWWIPLPQGNAEVERARIENDLAFRIEQASQRKSDQVESGATPDQSGTGNAELSQQQQQGTPGKDRPVDKRPSNPKPAAKPKPGFDLDRLAYAVAMAETKNGTLGYGKTHNNAFGIKKGNTVPCQTVGFRKMCKFDSIEDSYAAFKKIWSKHYGGFPNVRLASIWTGNDNPQNWLRIVTHYYYQ